MIVQSEIKTTWQYLKKKKKLDICALQMLLVSLI